MKTIKMPDYTGKIIAVDFDGTCVTHEYPKVGRDVGAVPVLRKLHFCGASLILWTMRSKHTLMDAVAWFRFFDIPLFGINQNPQQFTWTESPKAYAHIYIDDAAFGAPLIKGKNGERPYINWKAVDRKLFPK